MEDCRERTGSNQPAVGIRTGLLDTVDCLAMTSRILVRKVFLSDGNHTERSSSDTDESRAEIERCLAQPDPRDLDDGTDATDNQTRIHEICQGQSHRAI